MKIKRSAKWICPVVIAFIIYAVGAFVALSFDVTQWTTGGRLYSAMMWTFLSIWFAISIENHNSTAALSGDDDEYFDE